MQSTEITKKITSLVARQLEKSPEVIECNHAFTSILPDELDRMEIIMRLEDEFNIEISDQDVDAFISLNDVIKFIEEKSKRGA